ncbi:MAG: hypothetical protein RM021_017455 [Nostoc sp. EkiNYC01]|nr:hypothetical protein [Nostoc sp. EkiNYC01]
MVADLLVLQKQEEELTKTLNTNPNLPIKEKQSLDRKLNFLRDRIANVQSFEKLVVGDWVNKQNNLNLGKVTEKTLGNQPTVFVSWGEAVPIPEEPRLL